MGQDGHGDEPQKAPGWIQRQEGAREQGSGTRIWPQENVWLARSMRDVRDEMRVEVEMGRDSLLGHEGEDKKQATKLREYEFILPC